MTVLILSAILPHMYTASHARQGRQDDLDERIEYAVNNHRDGDGAYMRVYHDDSFRFTIESDLEERGFINIRVPDIILCGDVYFEWSE